MKKYYDMKDFQKDMAKKNVALCHRFREDDKMSEVEVYDDIDEILMEHTHEEYQKYYDIENVCKALNVSPDVVLSAKGVTDMITDCQCSYNKDSGKLREGELVIQVAPNARVELHYFDDMVRVVTSGKTMSLPKEYRDKVFESADSLNDFIDMVMVIEMNTQKLLEMNASGKSDTKSYKKLMEEQNKLKEDVSKGNLSLDAKTAKASARDIIDCYSFAFTNALDKVLVKERMIPKHGEIPNKKLFSSINKQMREKIEDNVYDREVSQILH